MSNDAPSSDPAALVRDLRQRALTVTATDIGIAPSSALAHVWGVIMETGYPEAVVSLVVCADGTTSLYFSTGGGIIGAGEHPSVRDAGGQMLRMAEAHLPTFVPVAATPFPDVGRVRFHVRTFAGIVGAEASEDDLGYGRHPLSPVFHAAHAVITAAREATDG